MNTENLIGGRGECPKCKQMVSNVALHAEYECKERPIPMTNEPKTSQSLEELAKECAHKCACVSTDIFNEDSRIMSGHILSALRTATQQKDAEMATLKLKAADRDEWQDVAMKVAAERDRKDAEIERLKGEVKELDRQVTLNRENWRMDSEDKDRTVSRLTARVKELEERIETTRQRTRESYERQVNNLAEQVNKLTAENAELRKQVEVITLGSFGASQALAADMATLRASNADAIKALKEIASRLDASNMIKMVAQQALNDAARNAERNNDQSASQTNTGRIDA